MKRKIVISMRDLSIIESDWYEVDVNSEPLYTAYSKSTKQDFEELDKLLIHKSIKNNDYESWNTKEQ